MSPCPCLKKGRGWLHRLEGAQLLHSGGVALQRVLQAGFPQLFRKAHGRTLGARGEKFKRRCFKVVRIVPYAVQCSFAIQCGKAFIPYLNERLPVEHFRRFQSSKVSHSLRLTLWGQINLRQIQPP